jgi:DNA-binding CsgD family transcriptional regulator
MPAFKQNVRLLQRAIEVNALYKQGKSLNEIAALLKVSQRTVRRDMDLLKK